MGLLVLLLISGVFTGVVADESRTALIAAGCVAGVLLVVGLTAVVAFVIIRYGRKQDKARLSNSSSLEDITTDLPLPPKSIDQSQTAHHTHPHPAGQHRGPGFKAYTQNAAQPRARPPVPFHTLHADPRNMPELTGFVHMGPSMYARPPQVGRPVLFLDRFGPPSFVANGGTFVHNHPSQNEGRHRHHSRDTHRSRQDRSRSRSKSRGSRRSSSSLVTSGPQAETVPIMGDIILRAKPDNSTGSPKKTREKTPVEQSNHFEMEVLKKTPDLHLVLPEKTESKVKVPVQPANSHILQPEEERYSLTQIQRVDTMYPSAIFAVSDTKKIMSTVPEEYPQSLPSPREDYPSETPSEIGLYHVVDIINKQEYHSSPVPQLKIASNHRTPTEDPLPSPVQDYPVDSPRSSMFPLTSAVKTSDRDLGSSSRYASNDYETTWTKYSPTSQAVESGEPTFELDDILALPSNSVGLSAPDSLPTSALTIHRRQQLPPSPPAWPPHDNLDSPILLNQNSDITFVKKTFTFRTIEDIVESTNRAPTPPLLMALADTPSIENTSPDPESHRNRRYRAPTPPPGLIKHETRFTEKPPPPSPTPEAANNEEDFRNQSSGPPTPPPLPGLPGLQEDFNIDDIINLGKSSTKAGAPEPSRSKSSGAKPNAGGGGGLPFLDELLRRRETIGGHRPTPPDSPLDSPTFRHQTRSGHLDTTKLPQKTSVVQFADEPPEIIHRPSSEEFYSRRESDESQDSERDSRSPTPGPPAPTPPPPPPLPSFLR